MIQSVCSVPLNCAITCYLWHTFESGLPTTLTELSLSFSFTQRSSATVDIIPLLPSFHCLTDFFVSDSPLGMSGIQCLEVAIQIGTFVKLESLNLSNTFTGDADINGALLATLLPSIASHSPHLEYFNLSKNNLGVPGASAVSELITVSRSKLELNLRDTNINAKAVAALFPSSRHSEPCCLSDLNLSKNPIGYDGLLAIFRMLKFKSLLCLEQSGRASLLIICTHVHFSLLCVLTCFISTVSSDGTAEVTTHPQTTPSTHDALSGMTVSDCDVCELVNVESTHMQECVD